MSKLVLIIALIISGAWVSAAPKDRKNCERILVSDQVQDKVNELGLRVAELVGELKIKSDLKKSLGAGLVLTLSDREFNEYAKIVARMQSLLLHARTNYRISAEQVDHFIQNLESLLSEHEASIHEGLSSAAVVELRQNPGGPERRFMKREVLTAFPEMQDMSGPEAEEFLRNSNDKPAPPYTGPGFREWPPREKP